MAYYNEQDDDEKQNQEIGQTIGTQTATIEGQQNTSSNQKAATAGQKNPNNFVGIQEYLAQNRPQTQALASKVSGYAQEQADAARGQLQNSYNQFQNQVNQNTVNYDPNLVQEAKTNTVQLANDQDKLAQFKKMKEGQYTGPKTYEETDAYQPAFQSLNKVQDLTTQLQAQAGRDATLANIQASKDRYSQGMKAFDSALLSSSPEAVEQVKQTSQLTSQLQDFFNKQKQQGIDYAKQAQEKSAQTRQSILDALGGEQSLLQSELEKRAFDKQKETAEISQEIKNKVKQNQELSNRDLAYLGITPDDLNTLKKYQEELKGYGNNQNFDLSQFINQINSPNSINAQTVATPEEVAKYQALNQLMDTQNAFVSNPSLAGQYNQDAIDFNLSAAKNTLGQALQAEKTAEEKRQKAEQEKIYLDKRRKDAQKIYDENPLSYKSYAGGVSNKDQNYVRNVGVDTILKELLISDGFIPAEPNNSSKFLKDYMLLNPVASAQIPLGKALKKLF